MIRCGAPVLLILDRNKCKNELKRQRSPPSHRRRNEEIDDGSDGENEKADDKDSEEDNDGISMEWDFVLNYTGTD